MGPSRSQTPSLLLSALLGGLVVAAFGWIAIISGWVEAEQAEPVAAGAPAVAKTVGQTWSDPAIGQVGGPSGKSTVITRSGFFPYTQQQNASRGGAVAGSTFYLLNIENGSGFDYRDANWPANAAMVMITIARAR